MEINNKINSFSLQNIQETSEIRSNSRIINTIDLSTVNNDTSLTGIHKHLDTNNILRPENIQQQIELHNISLEENNSENHSQDSQNDNQNDDQNDDQNDNQNDNDNANNNNINNIDDFLNIDIIDFILGNLHFDDLEERENNDEIKRKIMKLLSKLKCNNYIFIKDYPGQNIENNPLYLKWLKNIYIKNKINENKTENNYIKNQINQKFTPPDEISQLLTKDISKKIFQCKNPKCKSLVYIPNDVFYLLRNIPNLLFDTNDESLENFNKKRCPICLKYQCNFCGKTSTFLNAFCCPLQLIYSCGFSETGYYYGVFRFVFFLPFIKIAYFACLINFALFRGLVRKKYLLQSVKEVKEKINTHINIPSGEVYGVYQARFDGKMSFFIGLINILCGVCWCVPYVIICEVLFDIQFIVRLIMRRECENEVLNFFYFIAFLPGLRRSENAAIVNNERINFI